MKNTVDMFNKSSAETRADGVAWYGVAHDFAEKTAEQNNIDPQAMKGIVAAMSPGQQWAGNMAGAAAVAEAFGNKDRTLTQEGSGQAERGESPWSRLHVQGWRSDGRSAGQPKTNRRCSGDSKPQPHGIAHVPAAASRRPCGSPLVTSQETVDRVLYRCKGPVVLQQHERPVR